ncbi:cell wall-active antibiotics response protein LiaF [Brevibacillus sp. TJ4]|uniref:cell wall-active antibiotics response protein LiaF n=1 Tax=Brevibacillus sp. TJ4 TaxID=3234853 RepID=UPI0037CF43CA
MKLSRLHKMIAGVVIILTGIGLLLDSLGLISFSLFDLWPMVLVYFGARLWSENKRIRGGVLLVLGIGIALEIWFSVGLFDLFDYAIPILLIYLGFRLLRARNREKQDVPPERQAEADVDAIHEVWRAEAEEPVRQAEPMAEPKQRDDWSRYDQTSSSHAKKAASPGGVLRPKESRSSLIGDFHLTSGRFELHHMQIWHGIGDVVIDLSRAVLEQEEAMLSVEGWIGDVTIYVPVDLPVSVSADVSIGDLEVFGHRQGGISRSIILRSEQFDQALHKVHLHISLLVGDVKVKYI